MVLNPNYNGCTRWIQTAVVDARASTICQIKSVATDSQPDKWDRPIELPHVNSKQMVAEIAYKLISAHA